MRMLTRRPLGRLLVGCLVVATGLALAGVAGLAQAGSGTVARTLTVDGVPLLEVSPAGPHHAAAPAAGRPAVVVAHGFAGSARLMRGFADTLAAHGYVVALPDFAGHGASTRRLPPATGGAATGPLQRDLAVAVRHLRGLPSVDPSRVVLVGHSMGAAAVIAYAVAHPDIRATVAISAGSAALLPDDPARPRNLLLIVGGAELPGFQRAAREALHRADPAASFGTTTGDPAAGTARRAVRVTGVEHLSVLYATRTHAETAAWLDEAVAAPAGGPVHPRDRLVPAALLLAAFVLGFLPLAALLPARPTGAAAAGAATAAPAGRVRARYPYLGLAAGLALAVPGAGVAPTGALPLAVGGYAAGFFAIAGAGLLAAYLVARTARARPTPAPAPAPAPPPAPAPAPASVPVPVPRTGARRIAVAVVLVGYAAAAVAVPLHLGLTHAVPVGPRWWILPVVVGCVALLLVGVELHGGDTRWRRPLLLGATAAALLAAAVAGAAPGFVLLVLPLLVALLAWHAAWSAVLRRRSAPVWLPALVGATLVGWPVAVALPLTI